MSQIEEMVAKQVASHELRRRQEKDLPGRARSEAGAEQSSGPCLVLSREHGSGAERLAQLVGSHMGWQVFGREIIEHIAERDGVREQLMKYVDPQVRSRWTAISRGSPDEKGLSPKDRATHLRQVILALGYLGNAIILGRGAQYILPSHATLRLRMISPLVWRVQTVSERRCIPPPAAQREIDRVDTDRREFIRTTFSRDVGWPGDYDLVINTEELSVEVAARIIFTTLREKLGVVAEGAACAR